MSALGLEKDVDRVRLHHELLLPRRPPSFLEPSLPRHDVRVVCTARLEHLGHPHASGRCCCSKVVQSPARMQDHEVAAPQDVLEAHGDLEAGTACMPHRNVVDPTHLRYVRAFVERDRDVGSVVHEALRPAAHRAGHAAVTHQRARVVAHDLHEPLPVRGYQAVRAHAMVLPRPSVKVTCGRHPVDEVASVMSGHLTSGSSTGRSPNTISEELPASEAMSSATSRILASSGLPMFIGPSTSELRNRQMPSMRSST